MPSIQLGEDAVGFDVAERPLPDAQTCRLFSLAASSMRTVLLYGATRLVDENDLPEGLFLLLDLLGLPDLRPASGGPLGRRRPARMHADVRLFPERNEADVYDPFNAGELLDRLKIENLRALTEADDREAFLARAAQEAETVLRNVRSDGEPMRVPDLYAEFRDNVFAAMENEDVDAGVRQAADFVRRAQKSQDADRRSCASLFIEDHEDIRLRCYTAAMRDALPTLVSQSTPTSTERAALLFFHQPCRLLAGIVPALHTVGTLLSYSPPFLSSIPLSYPDIDPDDPAQTDFIAYIVSAPRAYREAVEHNREIDRNRKHDQKERPSTEKMRDESIDTGVSMSSEELIDFAEKLQGRHACPDCGGRRFRIESMYPESADRLEILCRCAECNTEFSLAVDPDIF